MSFKEAIQNWEDNKHAALKSELHPTLNIMDLSDLEKATLVLMGDEHIGNRHYNEAFHRQNLDWILETQNPIVLMGDELETATRDSVGAGVYEQQEIVEQQLEHFYDLYRPLAKDGLIKGIHPGNHEQRLWKTSGVNITKIMAKELGIKYLGWGKLHYIKVGDQGYTMYTTHGASGARLPHTKMKAAIDLANMVDAEIYAAGHVHQLAHHTRVFYKANLRNKTVQELNKHFILTGSYLTHWGSYGHVKNYEPMKSGSPKVKLSGLEHRIRVSI